MVKDWRLCPKNRKKTRMSPLATYIQHYTEGFSQKIRQEKEIKDIHVAKKGVKLSLFTDDMILYIQASKESTKKE